MSKSIILMHGYHDYLFSIGIYKDRVKEIKENKPSNEWALRLKLLKAVPNEELPQELVETALATYKAEQKYREADQKREEMCQQGNGADQKQVEARHEWARTQRKWYKLYQKHLPFLKELHERLCVCDCPYGETIFTHRDSEGVWF